MPMTALRPYLDKRPVLGARVYIDPACTVIGDVALGDDVSALSAMVPPLVIERLREKKRQRHPWLERLRSAQEES